MKVIGVLLGGIVGGVIVDNITGFTAGPSVFPIVAHNIFVMAWGIIIYKVIQ